MEKKTNLEFDMYDTKEVEHYKNGIVNKIIIIKKPGRDRKIKKIYRKLQSLL